MINLRDGIGWQLDQNIKAQVPASKSLLCKLEAARRGKALGVGHG